MKRDASMWSPHERIQAKQVTAEWSQLLCERNIPHMVFGIAAMLLHECETDRVTFKDIDILVPKDRAQEVRDILVANGFTRSKNGNYEKGDVTIGFATPETHPGLPDPTDDSAGTKFGGIRVVKLDGLINTKMLAVESLMGRIRDKGYRRRREESAIKHMRDFCALCRCIAKH